MRVDIEIVKQKQSCVISLAQYIISDKQNIANQMTQRSLSQISHLPDGLSQQTSKLTPINMSNMLKQEYSYNQPLTLTEHQNLHQ